MSLENQIRDRILQNFKSVRSFALSVGLPYTTVDTMLKKGIRFSSVELVSRVCHGLGLDLGALARGEMKVSPGLPTGFISDGEREHIRRYRALDRHGKHAVDVLLALELERVEATRPCDTGIPVAARSKDGGSHRITPRRDFSSDELEEEESEF